jgi:uncharacterized protein (TIGR02996 family)
MTIPEAELAPFLDAILAKPDADGPKLVLADFLEERGDRRGLLLREGVAWLNKVAALPVPSPALPRPAWPRQILERLGAVRQSAPAVLDMKGLSARQVRLLAVACARFTPAPGGRRLQDWLDAAASRTALAMAALFASYLAGEDQLYTAREAARGPWSSASKVAVFKVAVFAAAGAAFDAALPDPWTAPEMAATSHKTLSGGTTETEGLAQRWQAAVAALARELTPLADNAGALCQGRHALHWSPLAGGPRRRPTQPATTC